MNLDNEFFTRITRRDAKWFINRRNSVILQSEGDIQGFLGQINIMFPRDRTSFWTLVYFLRKLLFPTDAISQEHLKVWLERTAHRCVVLRKSRRPVIHFSPEDQYPIPIELWYTPAEFRTCSLPSHPEQITELFGEILEDNPLLQDQSE